MECVRLGLLHGPWNKPCDQNLTNVSEVKKWENLSEGTKSINMLGQVGRPE